MEFKNGNIVFIDTHAIHVNTGKSLNKQCGIITDVSDNQNILVKIKGIGIVGFSNFELHKKKPKIYLNEDL